MGTDAQDVVCAFVREIIEARIGEPVRVTDRPEQDHRSVKVVEERWGCCQVEAFRADLTPRCWQCRALKPHHLAARFELETST